VPAVAASLPFTEKFTPADQPAYAAAVAEARAVGQAVYPLGGETALDYGLPARKPGVGLSTLGLQRVIDYPARDMTITVEAGLTLAALEQTLKSEGQRLPIDAPQAELATLGGMVATNVSGPRRYGLGTLRDYIIGISAIDGRGIPFKAGGRVVKNVAGYDFCKLLTGSLGTIGIVTQLTFKLKPVPQRSVLLSTAISNATQAEAILSGLINTGTTPTAIEMVSGPAWEQSNFVPVGQSAIVVGLEGTREEVAWMIDQLQREWTAAGQANVRVHDAAEADTLWQTLTEFPVEGDSQLVLQASMRPSRVVDFYELVKASDVPCSVLAHAGSGVVVLRFEEFSAGDVSTLLVRQLQPGVAQRDGYLRVLKASSALGELPRQVVWGSRDASVSIMEAVRIQFDPDGILNPGRFVY
jgi:glycolate oxidase FAD binding subunit